MESVPPTNRFAKLYEKYGGDRAFTREILGVLVQDLMSLIESLETAFIGGNPKEIIKKAHSLSNISGTVLEMEINTLARSMEKSARDGDLAESAALYKFAKPLAIELLDAARREIAETPADRPPKETGTR